MEIATGYLKIVEQVYLFFYNKLLVKSLQLVFKVAVVIF